MSGFLTGISVIAVYLVTYRACLWIRGEQENHDLAIVICGVLLLLLFWPLPVILIGGALMVGAVFVREVVVGAVREANKQ